MTENNKAKSPAYEVGYGKPPVHSRFKKGQSGNPKGRPRSDKTDRAKQLLLRELYRPIKAREGDKVVTMPAIQAVFRSTIALALKGNGSAQRTLLAMAQQIETERRHDAERISSVINAQPMSEEEWAAKYCVNDDAETNSTATPADTELERIIRDKLRKQ